MGEKQLVQLSKCLSLVLRHQPEKIGIILDEQGWTNVDELLFKMNQAGMTISKELLVHLVETNPKKRFAFNDTQDMIRASQGHSIDIQLGYVNQRPPVLLYHGTAETSVQSILTTGIDKRSRQHVHLSSDRATAQQVGQRHGKPSMLLVDAERMFNDGFEFFLSDNGVWLTDHVPVAYLHRLEE